VRASGTARFAGAGATAAGADAAAGAAAVLAGAGAAAVLAGAGGGAGNPDVGAWAQADVGSSTSKNAYQRIEESSCRKDRPNNNP
jgi:hypothetical protein